MITPEGRMSWRIALVVGVPEEDWPDRQPGLSEAEVAERCGARVLREAGVERTPDIATSRWEAVGRGAAGYGLVIEVIGWTLAAGAGIHGWIVAAEKTRELWRRLKQRRPRPLLSLGALILLCTADLHERLGDLSGVELAGARDAGDRPPDDLTYTDEDVYEVEFRRREPPERWVYEVDSLGNLLALNGRSVRNLRRLRFRRWWQERRSVDG
jgi:hypothetical protein